MTCPHCNNTGYIDRWLDYRSLEQRACTCPAGDAFKAQIAAMATKIPEGENDHHN